MQNSIYATRGPILEPFDPQLQHPDVLANSYLGPILGCGCRLEVSVVLPDGTDLPTPEKDKGDSTCQAGEEDITGPIHRLAALVKPGVKIRNHYMHRRLVELPPVLIVCFDQDYEHANQNIGVTIPETHSIQLSLPTLEMRDQRIEGQTKTYAVKGYIMHQDDQPFQYFTMFRPLSSKRWWVLSDPHNSSSAWVEMDTTYVSQHIVGCILCQQ